MARHRDISNWSRGTPSKAAEAVNISLAGIAAIKGYEGCVLTAYPDPGTGNEPWTIGVGHTGGVVPGMTITEDEAGDLLREDIQSSEDAVNHLVTVPITQGQYDALVSFTFNLGQGALAQSTLLRKLNAGDYSGAAAEFSRWNQAAGKVLPGLVTRRAAEAKMFSNPVSLA